MGAIAAIGGAGAVGGVAAPAALAAAPLPTPAPIGDDAGFLQFGVLAERVSLTAYRRALQQRRTWTRDERDRFKAIVRQKVGHVQDLTAALGESAPSRDDYTVRLPARAFASQRGARRLLERLEQLLVGTYVNGSAFSADDGTRLLLSRLLVADAQALAGVRALRGVHVTAGLPAPIGLDAAGAQLDALLEPNGYPTS